MVWLRDFRQWSNKIRYRGQLHCLEFQRIWYFRIWLRILFNGSKIFPSIAIRYFNRLQQKHEDGFRLLLFWLRRNSPAGTEVPSRKINSLESYEPTLPLSIFTNILLFHWSRTFTYSPQTALLWQSPVYMKVYATLNLRFDSSSGLTAPSSSEACWFKLSSQF